MGSKLVNDIKKNDFFRGGLPLYKTPGWDLELESLYCEKDFPGEGPKSISSFVEDEGKREKM